MDPVHDFPSPHGTKTSKSQKRLHKTKPSPVGCCPIGLGYVFLLLICNATGCTGSGFFNL